jgi:hypothetical protein
MFIFASLMAAWLNSGKLSMAYVVHRDYDTKRLQACGRSVHIHKPSYMRHPPRLC